MGKKTVVLFFEKLQGKISKTETYWAVYCRFFCAKANLIVELDGGGHFEPEQQKKDQVRTDNIENKGYKIIRFTNREVDREFYSVCTAIDREVTLRTLPQSLPKGNDSSLKEGAKAR